MRTGMLWFDNSKSTLEVKISSAVKYFTKKHNKTPDLVLVHPSMVDGKTTFEVEGCTVRTYRPVLPGHIWIGIADEGEK